MDSYDKKIDDIINYRKLLKDVEKKQAIDDVKQQALITSLDLSIERKVESGGPGEILNGEFKYLYVDDENFEIDPKAFILVRFTDQQAVTSQLTPVFAGERIYAGDGAIWMKVEIFNTPQNKTVKIIRSLTDLNRQNLFRQQGTNLSIQKSDAYTRPNVPIVIGLQAPHLLANDVRAFQKTRNDVFQNLTGSVLLLGRTNQVGITEFGLELNPGAIFALTDLNELWGYTLTSGGTIIHEFSGELI